MLTSDNERHRLDREKAFGCFSGYTEDELKQLIGKCKINGLIDKKGLPGKPYFKIYSITPKGKAELKDPTMHEKKLAAAFVSTPIEEEDKILWEALGFFLQKYNDKQKQAITSRHNKILCVAGAGSGKTTVLTKRIEFLINYVGVPKQKILAITFTRKARQEMQRRLGASVQVETFNSFCEKMLNKHEKLLYGKPVHVMQYRDKIRILRHAMQRLELDEEYVTRTYFTKRQRSDKSKEQLIRMFLNDVYSILDYYANNDQLLEDFSQGNWDAQMVYKICLEIRKEMKDLGLRDYSDQIVDALRLFRKHPTITPKYTHILVDEYQDVNTVQQKLLEVLEPQNLFAVGDPRQSIFGWRGSKVRFILDFPKQEDAQVIVLTKNYRSAPKVVELMNESIRPFAMPDLEGHHEFDSNCKLHKFPDDNTEHQFIVEQIKKSSHPKEEIFVLARTGSSSSFQNSSRLTRFHTS